MKKYLGLILVTVAMQTVPMGREEAADLASNGVLVLTEEVGELSFADAHGRLISIEQMLEYAQKAKLEAKLPDSFDVKDMQATLEATPVEQYNALCARVIRRSKNGKDRLKIAQFLAEYIAIQKQMLAEMKSGGIAQDEALKVQKEAYQQQVKSARFARRSAFSAGAVSLLTALWGVISTYFAANPDCSPSIIDIPSIPDIPSMLANSTALGG